MNGLNDKQIENLHDIHAYFDKFHGPKYCKGAIEHSGVLSDCTPEQLLDMALEEVLDLMSYLVTLRTAMKKNKEGKW